MEEQTGTQETQQAQEMGVVQRMVGVFFSPGETFASVNRLASHKDWLIPLLLLILVGQVSLQFTMPLIKEMSVTQMRKQMEKSGNLSEEQIENRIQGMEKFIGISTRATVPFATIASGILSGPGCGLHCRRATQTSAGSSDHTTPGC